LAIDSRFFVYSCKSLRKNIWHINLLSNKLLLLSTVIATILLVAVFYIPALQVIFKTFPLTLRDWGLLVTLGLIEVALVEIAKWFYISRKKTA